MLNRRQLLAAAGIAGVGLTAAACSTGGSDTNDPSAPTATGGFKGTLNIVTPEFAGTEGKADFEGDILKKFTADHPDVKFQVDYTPWDKLN